MRRWPVLALLALVVAGCGGGGADAGTSESLVARGDRLYHGEGTCQTCHGADLRGTTMGPPFLDATYAPSHHPDSAFHRAVRNGVQPHHWNFGPMPALPHLSDGDVDAIVAYVRSVQEANGIR